MSSKSFSLLMWHNYYYGAIGSYGAAGGGVVEGGGVVGGEVMGA